ncbi:unnamed protein product [Rotaria sordida]|uniref:FAD dependent oxidoreductase n=1 Tax=Rotaria sordida TaxID=392033 RepID=A0A813RP24_9BILA|nr:unnamed protein product [Rotaria sordida]CAF3525540.1 unnamed protein product [Rotaria sordida]
MFVFIIFFITINSIHSSIRTIDDCQLLIIGGTTSALGALLSASKILNTPTCLLEPTDWIGGQLTAELLSAPDFAYHIIKDKDTNFTLNVGSIDRQLNNQNPLFVKMLNILGNTGHCWVSPKCSIPELFHSQVILPLVNNTRIFYNTVIKHIIKDSSNRRIIQIDAIQRSKRQTSSEHCRFLSEELPDWYSKEDSLWFTKNELSFRNISFVIEGSSWGEVLVLSNASYIQGLMEEFDGDTSGIGNSTCGQSFTFDFLEQLRETPVDELPNPLPEPTGGANYSFEHLTWERIWTYRRVNTSAPNSNIVAVNDLTIQNWSEGNDYRKEYFFLSPSDTQHQHDTNQWQGGVNLDAIENAERLAYGYHYWYRKNAPTQWTNRTVLIRSISAAGTCHGLAKMPYLRESRRSIGFENFLMNITTISGYARNLHGYIFDDRLCIGAYNVDIHSMVQCTYPSYMHESYSILPYYIPLRAMTNRDIDNLIVIGKTMAQTFLVNSATRLHPVEFSIGQAAGVVGTYAVQNNLQNITEILREEHLKRVQSIVKEFTPTSWTINGTRYPDD